MPFPVTYLLDRISRSETFIRRELDQLERRNWPVFTRLLNDDTNPLKFSLGSCPKKYRWPFFKASCARILSELPTAPVAACRIIKRLPQAAHLIKKVSDTESRLIHAQFAGITADLSAIAARAMGLPWTCAVHAYDVFTVHPRALHRRLQTAAGVTACSQHAADAVLAAGIPQDKVSVIHHGLPLNDFTFDTIQPDEVLFCACRLEKKKGLDTLLQACALLRMHGVRFTCIIAGTGPCLHELEDLRHQLELEQTVFFAGWQSEEETLTRMMDSSLLVLPSRRMRNGDRDGIANILLEAMALGTPVVTTTAGAAGEVITDNVNGLLVPPDDPATLADVLARALSSKELLLRLAKAARKTIENEFDGSVNIGQLEAFFKRAAGLPS